MEKITKDNKGITLIALIITIIIMLILGSVTAYTGINSYKSSRVNKFVMQMQLLQTNFDELASTKTAVELDELELQSVTTQEQIDAIVNAFKQEEVSTADTGEYKVFSANKILEILDVENIENDIMVNFETREIVSTIGIEYEGVVYYTQYKLPGGQTIINDKNETIRDLSFILTETIDGLNATITISGIEITNGTLSYRETGSDYWTTITNYTNSGTLYDIVITKSAVYEFKLTDNVTGKDSNVRITDETTEEIKEVVVPEMNKKEIIVTNKPKTSINIAPYNYGEKLESWAFAEKDSINYVWIPRFVYDSDDNIEFIKGNSNISTKNTYKDYTWKIHDKFTTDETELTGIWISLEGINQEDIYDKDLNYMIDLLDSDAETLIEI